MGVDDAPTGKPTIDGTPIQGQPLYANTTSIGDLEGIESLSYQWKDAVGVNITGATESVFSPTQAEVGKAITVEISYVDGGGTPNVLLSDATAAVADAQFAPVITTSTITGSAISETIPSANNTGMLISTLLAGSGASDADNDTLGIAWTNTTGTGTWQISTDGGTTWSALASPVSLTSARLLAKTDRIRYVPDSTGSNGTMQFVAWDGSLGGVAGARKSVVSRGGSTPYSATIATLTQPVIKVDNAHTGSVTVSGSPQVGQTFTASHTVSDGDGASAFQYQWQRLIAGTWTDIPGATSNTYVATEFDDGLQLRATVTYVDGFDGERSEPVASSATAAISGAPVDGSAITSTALINSGWKSDNEAQFSFLTNAGFSVSAEGDSSTTSATLELILYNYENSGRTGYSSKSSIKARGSLLDGTFTSSSVTGGIKYTYTGNVADIDGDFIRAIQVSADACMEDGTPSFFCSGIHDAKGGGAIQVSVSINGKGESHWINIGSEAAAAPSTGPIGGARRLRGTAKATTSDWSVASVFSAACTAVAETAWELWA